MNITVDVALDAIRRRRLESNRAKADRLHNRLLQKPGDPILISRLAGAYSRVMKIEDRLGLQVSHTHTFMEA